nr:MAG TPA: hypothetical protein [Bacteriophage sp.]
MTLFAMWSSETFQTTFFCVAAPATTGGARSPSHRADSVWVCFFMQR